MKSSLTPEDIARNELYAELQKGLDDVAAGRTIPLDEFMSEFLKKIDSLREEQCSASKNDSFSV